MAAVQPIAVKHLVGDIVPEIDGFDRTVWLEVADQIFDREWAIALLGSVMQRLQRDMERAGKSRQFELLRHTLTGEESVATAHAYRASAELGLAPAATRMAASRMRKRVACSGLRPMDSLKIGTRVAWR